MKDDHKKTKTPIITHVTGRRDSIKFDAKANNLNIGAFTHLHIACA